jgi:hypothetical protein
VTEPYALVAVTIYVVVKLGDTLVNPFSATEPIPWLRLTESAPVEVQVNVEEDPTMIVTGSTVILTTGRLFTVMVTLSVAVPLVFVAVIVYVVVNVGVTPVEPLSVTAPIPWSMLQLSALTEVQVSVAVPPSVMVSGTAEISTLGSCPTVIVTLSVTDP